jgi:hypothetical protein
VVIGGLTDEPTLPICAEVLHLDLSPLQKIVYDQGIPLGEGQTWETFKETAWQSPSELTQCIEQFIQALDSRPDVYRELEEVRQNRGIEFLNLSGFTDEEIADGFFQDELRSLKNVIILAQQEGATLVRLEGT